MKDKDLISELLDGIIIYKDCVYRDTYDNELSLGYVDCNYKTIEKYNNLFNYLIDQYGYSINSLEDIDGVFR